MKFAVKGLMVAICILLVTDFVTLARADTAIPDSKERVIDTTGTLSQDQRMTLMKKAEALDTQTGTVAVTVMVPTAGEEGIDDYAQQVTEKLHPGHAGDDRAVVLVIAKNDHKWAIRTTRNTGQTFTDADTKHVLDGMKEYMKGHKGDFNGVIAYYYDQLPPFVKKDESKMSVDPVQKPTEDEDHSVAYIAVGIMLFAFGVLFYILWSTRKDEERRREEEARRSDAERKARLERFRSERTPISSSATSFATGAAVGYTAAKVEKKPEKKSESSSYVDSWSNSSYSSDSSSKRSSSSDSSWSWSSSYDSGSSSSSFDGGGSSGSWD